jgi:hypothetical protein
MTLQASWVTPKRIILLVAVMLRITLPAISASALNACSGEGPWFDGVVRHPGAGDYTIKGAKAAIDIRLADVCSNQPADKFSSAWVMVASSNIHGYAQVGYMNRAASPTMTYFWQWTKDSTVQDPVSSTGLWGSPPVGETRTFKVERLGDGALHMSVGGAEPDCDTGGPRDCPFTSFDPLNVAAWDGMQGQWEGETHWAGSDMPGTSGSKTDFSAIQVKVDGSWVTRAWTNTGSDKCYYKLNVVDPNSHFQIWTQPLDHDC